MVIHQVTSDGLVLISGADHGEVVDRGRERRTLEREGRNCGRGGEGEGQENGEKVEEGRKGGAEGKGWLAVA